jgi:thiol:disulfide interchange protein
MMRNGVTHLKDSQITAFLRTFGRKGRPFYVFYPAGRNDPIILPSVLTEGIAATALRGKTAVERLWTPGEMIS